MILKKLYIIFLQLIMILLLMILRSVMLFSASYYVDDQSNIGDLWTPGAVGNDSNNGQTILTPKATVTNLLSSYSLQPGDAVYIDTGVYTQFFKITSDDDGLLGNYVSYKGAGINNTIFNVTNINEGVKLTNINYVRLNDFSIIKANNQNLFLDKVSYSVISNIKSDYSRGDGVFLNESDYNKIFNLKVIHSVNYGIYLYYGNDKNFINNNDVSSNSKGIYIRYGSYNAVNNNIVYSNNAEGIYMDYANYCIFL